MAAYFKNKISGADLQSCIEIVRIPKEETERSIYTFYVVEELIGFSNTVTFVCLQGTKLKFIQCPQG